MRTLHRSLVLLLGLTLAAASVAAADDHPRAIEADGVLPVEGTAWRLREYRYRGVDRTSGPEAAAWMTLRDGRLSGSTGCDVLKGHYAVMGAAIDLRIDGDPRTDCAEQTVIVQLGMLDGLRRAASARRTSVSGEGDAQLELLDAHGERLLRFEPDDAGTLEGVRWQLDAWTSDGVRTDAVEDQIAVLSYERRRGRVRERYSTGELVGSTGCNAIVAEYFRYADVMSYGELERTDAPCSDALVAQEAAMTRVLDATSSTVVLPPDRLLLSSADGVDVLELISTTPLEGTTWIIDRILGSARGAEPLTLRLEDGLASGSGPCGHYSASYSTDGVFLSFADLTRTSAEGCDGAALERTLLATLRDTALIERTGTTMRFLDPRGRTRLRAGPARRP
jgi:heat shock protein HslJ